MPETVQETNGLRKKMNVRLREPLPDSIPRKTNRRQRNLYRIIETVIPQWVKGVEIFSFCTVDLMMTCVFIRYSNDEATTCFRPTRELHG